MLGYIEIVAGLGYTIGPPLGSFLKLLVGFI
jgi:hypothetical protein